MSLNELPPDALALLPTRNLPLQEPPTPSGDPADNLSRFAPLPSSYQPPLSSATLTPLVCDERAISRLLEVILSRGGLTMKEAADRLGVSSNTIRQYVHGRRSKPSLIWFVKLANLCGARVVLEFPKDR